MNQLIPPKTRAGNSIYRFFIVVALICGLAGKAEAQKDIKVLDVEMPVAGTEYAQEFEKRNEGKKYPWLYYNFGFQEGDVIELDLKRQDGKATYDLEVQQYGSEAVMLSRQKFSKLHDLKFTVPQKGIYKITIKSNHPETSEIRLKITRNPASAATRNFKTHVNWVTRYDSVFTYTDEKFLVRTDYKPVVLVDRSYKVGTKGKKGLSSRLAVPFQLPENATHWVYWIGVGQESLQDLQKTARTIPENKTGESKIEDPLTAFGLGLIPKLPAENASGFIDFLFMDPAAAKPFLAEGTRQPFKFASGNAIINAYGKIMASQTPQTEDKKLVLGIENTNSGGSQEVIVKIIAFVPDPKFETRRVKKLSHLEDKVVPVIGE